MVNRMNLAKTVILITAFFLFLCSCSSSKWNRIDQKNDNNSSNGVLEHYLIQPGDSLEIRFFYYSELNDRVIVRPDGRIKLQLIPEVSVAGLTVKELNEKLIQLYTNCIRYTEISVTMRGFAGQRVFVGGEVGSPQVISLTGRMDVVQAIFQAGGVRSTACQKSVIVITRDHDNRPKGKIVNVDAFLNGKKGGSNVFLRPYDIVIVPKTKIAKVNQFVEQYIRNVLPVQTNFQGSYNMGRTRIVD